VLTIQGPPGAGKTHTAATVISALIGAGKTVGITGPSHNVIRGLLTRSIAEAEQAGVEVRAVVKVSTKRENTPGYTEVTENPRIWSAVAEGEANLVAGTSWLWANDSSHKLVDVLFVDEAGQLSLASTLAAARGARSLVLLGDPQQLEQPLQGTHPEGVAVSALQHVLGGAKTIADEMGIFLAETWRLAPAVCSFTSELFYDRRLRSRPGLENQALRGTNGLDGAGLWYAPVHHRGNQSTSSEEVSAVDQLIDRLLIPGAAWTDSDGAAHAMTPNDILVVAPYNAQVARLEERLSSRGIRVGTVDRFQGQEAPVVIFGMTTSTAHDAPRGMEFLFSPNRLNVASSRAKCACILVASPALFEPECKTVRHVQLVNAFCRYRELARVVGG
jgi:uncharacterized protein